MSSSSSSPPMLASVAGNLKVWSWDGGEPSIVTQYSSSDSYHCFAWNHSNRVIAIAGKESKVDLVDVSNGQVISTLPVTDAAGQPVARIHSVAFAQNSRFLATSIGSPVQLWDLKKRQVRSVFAAHRSTVTALAFNARGDVYAADESGAVKLWSYKTPEEAIQELSDPSITLSALSAKIQCMQLSPLGTGIALGSADGSLRVWDSNSGSLLRTQRSHSGALSALSWSPRNPRLLSTAGMDGKLLLVNTNDAPHVVSAVVDVQRPLCAVSHHENGFNVAVGTNDGTILIYDWRKTAAPVVRITAEERGFSVTALSWQVPRFSAAPVSSSAVPPSAPAASEPPSLSSNRSSATETVRRAPAVTPATSLVSLNSKPPSPPVAPSHADKHSVSSRTSTPSKLSTSALSHSANSFQQQRSSNDISYSTSSPHSAPAQSGSPSVPTTDKAALNAKGSFFGSARGNPEMLQKVNSLISDYEKSLRPVDLLESPRASTAPSRNRRTAMENEKDREDLPPPQLSVSSINRSLWPSQPNETTSMDSVQLRAELRKIEKEVEQERAVQTMRNPPISASTVDADDDGGYKRATVFSAQDEAPPAQEQTLVDSFQSRYAQRMQAMTEVGGYSSSPLPTTASPQISKSTEHTVIESAGPHSSSSSSIPRDTVASAELSNENDEFYSLKQALRPVTSRELEESLELLKYDIHREVQEIIREQVRQFSIAKDDTTQMIRELSLQLTELLIANKELREENERLRKIY